MVEVPRRPDCILLRPFSYYLAPEEDHIALLVKDAGKGTHSLLTTDSGTDVVVVGPLGNAFPEPTGRCWAVAGGVGAAPFGELAARDGVRILFGARTVGEAGFASALREQGGDVEIATDDGSQGFRGTVGDMMLDLLAKGERPDTVFACGPEPMMAAVARVASEHALRCWVSLEERMGCGIGVCRGCAHRDAAGGWRCICEDGPVYDASVIYSEASA
jgi:dihydroorotate dehydrogenase electron transfer subunit